MRIVLWMIWFVTASVFGGQLDGKQTIYTAVAPEFKDGLHSKYLKYLAQQLGMDVHISEIPYARRLRELDHGKIDIMVGVSNLAPIGEHTERIFPPYESLSVAFFERADNPHPFKQDDDLFQRYIGITRNTSRTGMLKNLTEEYTVELTNLQQKIEMLSLGRIDGFFHVKQSAMIALDDLNLSQQIRLAELQPPAEFEQHVAINRQSALWPLRFMLERIIQRGVEQGDFKNMRRQHYAQERLALDAESVNVTR